MTTRTVAILLLALSVGACRPDAPATPPATSQKAAPEVTKPPAEPPAEAGSVTPPPTAGRLSPELQATLEKLFPKAGREDLVEVVGQVQDARADLPPQGLATTQTDHLLALLQTVQTAIPAQVASGDADAVAAALQKGFTQGLGLVAANLKRFWELKLEADKDDGAPMPADVQHLETYDRNAKLGSALAGFCARGMGAFLEQGDLGQRSAAHTWFAKAFREALSVAGGRPVLAPTADTPPAGIVATGHAGKLAEALDRASKAEPDPELKRSMLETLNGFRKPQDGP